MGIIEEIRDFVEEECRKPESRYGSEPFTFHFIPMVNYAERLAIKLGADREVVLIAAWLHDIGSIMHGREDHHITGAEIAEKLLSDIGYPKDKIELVRRCILNHRGSLQSKRQSVEEQIIAEADAMSNFDNIAGIFKAAFVYEDMDQGQAKDAVRKKLDRKWNQLSQDSKELVRPRYEAAMLLLR